MTDRELLELAAKAAGMCDKSWGWDFNGLREYRVFGVPHCGFDGSTWNPLTDDGDALRLAVKCRIEVYEGTGDGPEAWAGYYLPDRQRFVCEPHRKDPYAATRRAIVRAAAEIGSSIK